MPNIANNDAIGTDAFAFSQEHGSFGQAGINSDVFRPGTMVVFGDQSPFRSVEELYTSRPGTPFSSTGPRTYTRRFRVMVKTSEIGASFVCRCPGLPEPFAPYIPARRFEYDPYARAVNISADTEKDDDWQAWVVVVQYSTEMPAWGPLFGKIKLGWDTVNGIQNKPWLLPPVIETDTETFTDYPLVDLDNLPYTDAAGRPFRPAPGFQAGYKAITITRNEKDFDTRTEDYILVTNSSEFRKAPTGYALCLGPRATEVYLGTQKYHRVTYRVLLKKREKLKDGTFSPGWNPVNILNAGMYQRASLFGAPLPANFGLVPIVKFGVQVTDPVLLDDDGKELVDVTKPTFISRRPYRSVNLGDLLNPAQIIYNNP